MKTTPILYVAGISLVAALAAYGAAITPPPTPPPFAAPAGGPPATGSGSMRAGQSPGSSTSLAASAQVESRPIQPATPAATVTTAPQTPAEAPPAIVPTGHVELFNGKDFTGWQFVSGNASADPKATWSVADGLIKCTGVPNGYARTTQAYKDYMVTVEWRFLPGETRTVNTGVVVHITPPETMNPWPKSIECQGRHTTQGDFWFWNGAACKELTSLPADQLQGGRRNGIKRQAPDAEKPIGEWNTFSVICRGTTVTILVNGKEVNKITESNLTSGYIGLQSEGGPVEIRKVSLDPAPAETPKPPKEVPAAAAPAK